MAGIKLKEGYNIRIKGEALKEIVDASYPSLVSVKPTDFIGLKPKLLVAVGDRVKIGSPLFHDRNNKEIIFIAPASGKVVEIKRGERRKIESVIIATDGKRTQKQFNILTKNKNFKSRETIIDILLQTGLFPLIKKRPFNKIADPTQTPRDIFISTFNTAPLAANTNLIVQDNEQSFKKGIEILKKLTTGNVYISLNKKDNNISKAFINIAGTKQKYFQGPHPAGNVGVQIHHIKPISSVDDCVWTCNVQAVVTIGKLFLEKKISPEIIVAVAGCLENKNKYYRTIIGASFQSILNSEININNRYISGDVLTGQNSTNNPFIGFYDNLLTIITEANEYKLLGWFRPGFNQESNSKSFISKYLPKKNFKYTTNQNGSIRAFIATDLYKEVLPMDIYPVFLLKSILAEDISEMEGLGILEVAEEDLALCEYVCPSKIDIQNILRKGLDLIEKELID